MYERELEFALQAAQSAGHLLREGFHAGFPSDLDENADQCIHEILSPAFPNYGYRTWSAAVGRAAWASP
jgi:hypothetical protein